MQNGLKSTDTNRIQEVMAKRTAKNSVFLDLFQNKSYLLKLYKTLHPEDITATEDSLTDITIENVLTIFPTYQPRLLQEQESKNAEA